MIFINSMAAKITAKGYIVLLYVIFSVIYYEIVIQLVSVKKPILIHVSELGHMLTHSNDENEILRLLEECNTLYKTIEKDAISLY